MLGFDNKVKNDVMQTLGILCKNSDALSQWTENPDKFNSAQFSKDNNYQTGMASKYTNQLEIDNSLRRENSASNVVGALTESIWKKQSHPLSKVSLLNKTYFMILLISRKVTPDNILKVIQYFQNYYPQNYDTNCSIWSFLHSHISESLKKWSSGDTSPAYSAHEFFTSLWCEYDEKILKRFQITKSNQNNQNTKKIVGNKKMYSSGLQSGVNSVLGKLRNDRNPNPLLNGKRK